MKSRALMGVCVLGLRHVIPACPGYARRFDPHAVSGAQHTMLGPLVSHFFSTLPCGVQNIHRWPFTFVTPTLPGAVSF